MYTLIYGSFTDDVFVVCRDCESIDSWPITKYISWTNKNGFRCVFFRNAPTRLNIENGVGIEETECPKTVCHFDVV